MLTIDTIREVYNSLSVISRANKRGKDISSDFVYKNFISTIPDSRDRDILLEAFDALSLSHRNSSHRVAKVWKAYKDIIAPTFPPKPPSSNEKTIRGLVVDYLHQSYQGYTVRHEFTSWQLPVRPDVMAIGDGDENPIITVEIKSDKDGFDRIYRQLSEYGKFSSAIYLALDEKHLVPFLNKYGSRFHSIGILVYSNNELVVYKKAYVNSFGLGSLFHLMWSSELKLMIAPFKGRSKLPNKDAFGMEAVISSIYSQREVREITKAIVLWRLRNHEKCKQCIFHDINIEDFCADMPTKRKLFTVLLNPDVWEGRLLSFSKFNAEARKALS